MASIDLETLRQQSRLFSLLDEAGQQRLLAGAEERRYASGQALMREGEAGDDFFVIVSGVVRVTVATSSTGAGGAEEEVARLGQGAFVGEIAAIMGESRNATVTCDGEVTALRFEAARVNEVLKDYPRVREALVKLALKRSEDNLQRLLEVPAPSDALIPDDES